MATEILPAKRRKPHGLMTLLSYAACEWFLIFLLFLDAALSYLLVKFAHYCDLKEPCPLCSRLDHIFGKTKQRSYYTLLCSNHKEEISSLVPCSIHGNFADIHSMCEECLLPIATQKKPNSESYRLLAGKLWVDVEQSVFQHLVLNKYIQLGSCGRRTCLCCNKTWRTKSNAERLLEFTKVGLGASKANVKPPLPRAPGRSRFSRRDSLKRLREKFTCPMRPHTSSNNVGTLSHLGYAKLKIASDSESEFQFSEDDDDTNTVCSFRSFKSVQSYSYGEHDAQFGTRVVQNPVILGQQPNLLDLSEHKNAITLPSDGFVEHGLGELNWPEYYHKPTQCLTTELILLDDGTQAPNDDEGKSIGSKAEEAMPGVSLTHMPAISLLSELLAIGPSLSNPMTVPMKTIDVHGTSEKYNTSPTKHTEVSSSEDISSSKQISANLADASENQKLSSNHEIEQINIGLSSETEEDMKSPPKVSTAEVALPSEDSSAKANEHKESRKDDDSSSNIVPVSNSIPRTSSHESLDGINVTDIEDERIIDRLKRQMNSLYKELEEERNAAAIAANEAMAMITRLQEEKATLHMEALQYLRMMEEQAEYDMEALEKANDLLAEKEKELQDLETELEFYRNNLLDDESGVHDLQKESLSVKNNKNNPGALNHSKCNEILVANGHCTSGNSTVSKFEDEKLYIEQCLRKLEEKLLQNGINFENSKDQENDAHKVISSQNGDTHSNGSSTHDKVNDCINEKSGRGEVSSDILKEIEELHDRLEAIETDRDFLDHASVLLRNGEDGLHWIQEVAHQLHALRKLEFRKR